MSEVTEKRFVFQDAREMVAVLGETDEYLRQMQRSLGCQLIPRGNELIAQGKEQDVELAGKLCSTLRRTIPRSPSPSMSSAAHRAAIWRMSAFPFSTPISPAPPNMRLSRLKISLTKRGTAHDRPFAYPQFFDHRPH